MDAEARREELVKPIVTVLTGDRDLLPRVVADLERHFGKCDFQGGWHRFDHSRYYEAEMGGHLWRCMLSFEKLLPGWHAMEFKRWTGEIEGRYSVSGHRQINCDPGYVDHLKMVLISGKHGGFRVLVSPGVWVDVLLWYNKGWQPFPWTFPDFHDGTYSNDLVEIRKLFKVQAAGRASAE